MLKTWNSAGNPSIMPCLHLFVRVVALLFVKAITAVPTSSSTTESLSSTQTQATVALPTATVIGSIIDDIEYYRGIPFAQPPNGSLRLKPPVRPSSVADHTIIATGIGPSCPQMTQVDLTSAIKTALKIPAVVDAVSILQTTPNITEDCLTLSIMRPRVSITSNASLPVLLWIYGGGYELGSSVPYNGSVLIPQSVAQGTPMILVTINYRLGGFGFLPGAEVLAEGIANLGLLDQRLALEWVADNIGAFGGDPEKVTIWGESAGSFSVFNQMSLYGGDITYKGRPLFRAGIMNSGTMLPTEPIDAPRAQIVFNTVVRAADCDDMATGKEKLDCLRKLPYETYLNVTNRLPSPFSYHSPVSSFTVRADGHIIRASPDVLVKEKLYAPVPIIVGDQEDEGTFLSLTQTNLTTVKDLLTFLGTTVYQNASRSELETLIGLYPPNNSEAGSPFGTNNSANEDTYPQFKRLAAILGDVTFTMMRRSFLDIAPTSLKAWSYLSTYGKGTPIVGTFHSMDLFKMFVDVDDVSVAMRNRYIAFVHGLDPNCQREKAPIGFRTKWPLWSKKQKLMNFGAQDTGLLKDDFREEAYRFIKHHLRVLRT